MILFASHQFRERFLRFLDRIEAQIVLVRRPDILLFLCGNLSSAVTVQSTASVSTQVSETAAIFAVDVIGWRQTVLVQRIRDVVTKSLKKKQNVFYEIL